MLCCGCCFKFYLVWFKSTFTCNNLGETAGPKVPPVEIYLMGVSLSGRVWSCPCMWKHPCSTSRRKRAPRGGLAASLAQIHTRRHNGDQLKPIIMPNRTLELTTLPLFRRIEWQIPRRSSHSWAWRGSGNAVGQYFKIYNIRRCWGFLRNDNNKRNCKKASTSVRVCNNICRQKR